MSDPTHDELLDKLREQVPAKSASATSGQQRRHVPAWRVNRATESKALQQAFKRHKASTPEAQAELVDTIVHGYQHIARYRKAALGADEFVALPRMLATWLNQDGWLDEFDIASSELAGRRSSTSQCECGGDATHRDYNAKLVCKRCFFASDPEIEKIRQSVMAKERANPRQPGESWYLWSKRLLRDCPVGRVYLKKIGEY